MLVLLPHGGKSRPTHPNNATAQVRLPNNANDPAMSTFPDAPPDRALQPVELDHTLDYVDWVASALPARAVVEVTRPNNANRKDPTMNQAQGFVREVNEYVGPAAKSMFARFVAAKIAITATYVKWDVHQYFDLGDDLIAMSFRDGSRVYLDQVTRSWLHQPDNVRVEYVPPAELVPGATFAQVVTASREVPRKEHADE